METLNLPAYLLISEIDVKHQIKNSDPIFKVDLYGEILDGEPMTTLYIKFFLQSSQRKKEYETAIRTIIKAHSINTLAYKSECLN